MNTPREKKNERSREEEYAICKLRGHQSTGVVTTMGIVSWRQCKWCGTSYRFAEPELIEEGAP